MVNSNSLFASGFSPAIIVGGEAKANRSAVETAKIKANRSRDKHLIIELFSIPLLKFAAGEMQGLSNSRFGSIAAVQ